MDLNDGKRMFGDIKSKLGFGRKDGYEEFYDDYEEYDEDDYGEYGYDESYARPSSGSHYDPYDSVTTREVGSRSTGRSSMPRLVSIDDVRARTQVPSLGDRDSDHGAGGVSSRRASGSSSFRTMVDSSLPPQMTPEGTAAASAAASAAHSARSEGLNSLFEPTTAAPADERPSAPRNFGTAATRTAPSRTLKVIKPLAYNDAEAISTALKLGDAVVLCLTGTPDALAKRILDFSFGVASALDANVESVGNKVFALTRINELSEGERSYLRSQGLA